MTSRPRRGVVALLLALVVLAPLVGAVGAGTVAAESGPQMALQEDETPEDPAEDGEGEGDDSTAAESDSEDTTDAIGAELLIRQPSYVDREVHETTSDGTPVYEVHGDELLLRPQNFDAADVTDFGVATSAGELRQDGDWDAFTFDPEGNEGTFEVYWSVATDDGATERYTAEILVDGGVAVSAVGNDELADLREMAALGEDVDTTLTEIRESDFLMHYFDRPDDNQALFQTMVDRYVAVANPATVFFGESYRAIITLSVLSLGGIFLWAKVFTAGGGIIYLLKRKLNIYETAEAQEGDLADRELELEQRERKVVLGNLDFQDIPGFNDHYAEAFREHLGETTLDAYQTLRATFTIDELRDARIRAMGDCGYVAEVDEWELTDGGDADLPDTTDGDPDPADAPADAKHPVSATIVRRADVLGPDESLDDHDNLVALDDPSERLLAAIADDDPAIWEFDLVNADLDEETVAMPLGAADLDTIIEELDPPMEYFDNKQEFGQLLSEFVQHVEQHPISEDGEVNEARMFLNVLLNTEQYLGDVHNVPGARARAEAIERALIDHDVAAETKQRAKEVGAGATA